MLNQPIVEQVYEELKNLIRVMAHDACNSSHWQLDYDELYGELLCKMVEVVLHYHHTKSFDDLKYLTITSLRNHLISLKRRVYSTHRAVESVMLSLDDESIVEPGYCDAPRFDEQEFCSNLSDDATALVREILHPSEYHLMVLSLTLSRKQNYGGCHWSINMTPILAARIMRWDMLRLQCAWQEIEGKFTKAFS
jgi:hypothetical protein